MCYVLQKVCPLFSMFFGGKQISYPLSWKILQGNTTCTFNIKNPPAAGLVVRIYFFCTCICFVDPKYSQIKHKHSQLSQVPFSTVIVRPNSIYNHACYLYNLPSKVTLQFWGLKHAAQLPFWLIFEGWALPQIRWNKKHYQMKCSLKRKTLRYECKVRIQSGKCILAPFWQEMGIQCRHFSLKTLKSTRKMNLSQIINSFFKQ